MGDAIRWLGSVFSAALSDPGAVLFNTARIFSSVFEIVLAYILAAHFYRLRVSRRFPDTLVFAGVAAVMIAVTEYGALSPYWRLALECALLGVLLFALYAGPPARKAAGLLLFAAMLALSRLGASLLTAGVKGEGTPEHTLLVLTAQNAVMLLLSAVLAAAARRADPEEAGLLDRIALLSVSAVTLLCFTVFRRAAEAGQGVPGSLPEIYAASAGLIFVNVLVFILFGRLNRQMQLRREADMLRAQVGEQARSITRLETVYNRTRAFRHDIKNHILVLDLLARQGKTEELRDYLSQLSGVIDESDYVRITGVSAVDALLNVKMYEAEAQSITTAFDVSGMELGAVEPLDLCVILSNALDNAIEGSAGIEDPTGRFLRVKIRGADGYCVISVANPCAKEPKRGQDGRFLTDKPDADSHGLGLKSIENTVKKYSGETVARCEDGVFTLVVRLNASGKEADAQ